ncbi:endolytic transglycosylase MltG [Demequina subtropica]|uniref:endolytic transglycosylase MltG n=1 Tax=Demequina subtropica TaxID=1638989 RepID=UPI000784CEFB|nr:endolytic transglycosylase MltG [Demequina subtropica]
MTDLFEAEATTTTSLDLRRLQRSKRRAARRRMTLLVTAVAVVVLTIGGSVAYSFLQGFESTEEAIQDYEGAGQGNIQVVIPEGATGTDMAATLLEDGVIASTEAFMEAWNANPDASSVQPGYYYMHKEMKAEYALDALLDPSNKDVRTITAVEGKSLDYYKQAIANLTGASQDEVQAAMDNTEALGLPEEANGNLEGWLFPDTYTFDPGVTPQEVLTAMVQRTINVLDKHNVKPEDRERVLTVASLVEREAKKDEDRAKIASVIYNRVDADMKLELDSTVKYLSPTEGVWTTDEERAIDSPYNTYMYPGLPPGPIAGAGEKSIEAAINPAETDYLFFVTVNLKTGETKYATEYADHLANVQELRDWAAANSTSTDE